MKRILGSTSLALLLHALHVSEASAQAQAEFPAQGEAAAPASQTAPAPASTAVTPSATPPIASAPTPPTPPTTTVPAAPVTSAPATPYAAPATPLVFADDGSEPTRWYGWQILMTDGAALTLFVLAAADPENEEAWITAGATTAYLGGPLVHAGHGNWGRAAGSLGLRVGAPFLTALIGSSMEDCSSNDDFCGLAGAVLGFTVGAVTAITIDVAVLAHESEEPSPAVTPTVSVSKNMGTVGVVGRF
jgi:hypothetical protein